MTINVELLDRTLAHIEAHPEEWEQVVWRCNTGMCFAGWAAAVAGSTWAYPETAIWDHESQDPRALLLATSEDAANDIEDDCVHVEDRAQRLLGLNWEQAEDLFAGGNRLSDLRRIVADLKATAQ